MTSKFTDADSKRAREFVAGHPSIPGVKAIAQAFADIRNETIERCAAALEDRELHSQVAHHAEMPSSLRFAAGHIRALKDGGK